MKGLEKRKESLHLHATYPSSLFITLHSQSQNVNPTQHLPFFHWWTNPTTTNIPLIPIDPSHKKGSMSTLAIIFRVFLIILIVILAILIVFLYLLKKKLNGGATGPPPPPGVRRQSTGCYIQRCREQGVGGGGGWRPWGWGSLGSCVVLLIS